MKIQLFSETSLIELQKNINNWLTHKEGVNVKVKDFKFSTSSDPQGLFKYIMIIYEEI